MAVKPVPDGYHSVQLYMMVKSAKDLVAFLENVFDGTVIERMVAPDGRLMHAEVRIGDSVIMLADAQDPWPVTSSAAYIYVPDVDATYKRALGAGATSVMEPANQFYGDRHGGVKDEFGNFWWIATRVENVSREEIERRAKEHMQNRKS